MIRLTQLFLFGGLAVTASRARAQGAPAPPLARSLGPLGATLRDSVGAITNVRALPNGRVLVNDAVLHRVVLYDSTFGAPVVVVDSVPGLRNSYGRRPGWLIPYLGDSTLFIDPAALSFLVIDPDGAIARVMAIPRVDDVPFMTTASGNASFDGKDAVVYKRFSVNSAFNALINRGLHPDDPKASADVQVADSAVLVRANLTTRVIDTIARLALQPTEYAPEPGRGRERVFTSVYNPMRVDDDWAVAADGTTAVVRALDYHIDWVARSGVPTASPRIPHEWERLTDSVKAALVDSVRDALQHNGTKGIMLQLISITPREEVSVAVVPTFAVAPRPGASSIPGIEAARAQAPTAKPDSNALPIMELIDPSELPDYPPPFSPGATEADPDGNLWVHVNVPNAGPEALYDIIDRAGHLTGRVKLPAGYTLAAIGHDVVYLTWRDGTGQHLRRALLH